MRVMTPRIHPPMTLTTKPMHRSISLLSSLLLALTVTAACGDDNTIPTGSGPGSGAGPSSGPGGGGAGAMSAGGNGAGAMSAGGGGGGPTDVLCATPITFEPTWAVQNVRVAGEWQGFDLATAVPMTGPSAGGEYTATVDLPPGLHGYKIVYDDANGTQWVINPSEGRRKYVGGVENSGVKVRDCSLPSLDVETSVPARPSAGQGTYEATLDYVAPLDGTGPDTTGFEGVLLKDDSVTPLSSSQLTVTAQGQVSVNLSGLADGKYRVVVRPRSTSGLLGEPQRLVFWIEAEKFSWDGALVYMVLTDRYRNGDPGNDADPTPGADPRGDWAGGDLDGLRQSIDEGKLDQLGVRAIWLTPFQTNPESAFYAADGVHQVTGYHGYWPTKAREVDPRLGGEAALRALVKEAHEHGIRILQDYVVNHVHEEHEYFQQHPDWFRTGCVCGTSGCDWTEKALECLFADYMPDINHSVPEANKQFVDDAVWWLDEFDLDGLRVDAVKHVEEVATRNLSLEVQETFEAAGTEYFLMGETAMGWSDCNDPCNDGNYGTIAKYVGPAQLDGQFDFVLYHGVSYRTFAYGDRGMLHADYWLKHGLSKWPEGAVMTPYIGSHDTPRFTSLADYRGQDPSHDRGIPGNQWNNTAVAPGDSEPYRRMRIGMAWLLNLPGAPLLYYGDEYGQWGGADPNNRLMWRSDGSLSAEETATLSFVRKLGTARATVPALQTGDYVTLFANEDTLVFGRKISQGNAALVALTRSGSPVPLTVEVTGALGWSNGTVLDDAIDGPNVTVTGGNASFTIPGSSAVVLHP
jgi:neopullulanase